ncbi:Bro-N domain-containing protein, partial [Liquorilactobacillus sp.]
MNQLRNFDFQGNKVRTVEISNEPCFVGKDVAGILGYSNTRDALANHVDEEDKYGVAIRDSIGREQTAIAINESGLYSL